MSSHNAHMRTLSITILVVATALSVLFFARYTKTVHWLVDGGFETNGNSFSRVCFDLRSDINVAVWRALPQARSWAHDGWSLFQYGDVPEGTKSELYFPSWYLLIALSVVFGVGLFDIVGWSKRRTA
jgi:hypothetical protein